MNVGMAQPTGWRRRGLAWVAGQAGMGARSGAVGAGRMGVGLPSLEGQTGGKVLPRRRPGRAGMVLAAGPRPPPSSVVLEGLPDRLLVSPSEGASVAQSGRTASPTGRPCHTPPARRLLACRAGPRVGRKEQSVLWCGVGFLQSCIFAHRTCELTKL